MLTQMTYSALEKLSDLLFTCFFTNVGFVIIIYDTNEDIDWLCAPFVKQLGL